VQMSVYVIRAFVRLREHVAANRAILQRLAEIDKTLLQHDAALRDIYRKLSPLLQPPPDPPKRRIGFLKDQGWVLLMTSNDGLRVWLWFFDVRFIPAAPLGKTIYHPRHRSA